MEHIVFAFNALSPLLILALIGYFLRRINLMNTEFINGLNKFIFNVALPVLLFTTMANLTDFTAFNFGLIIFSVLMVCLIKLLGMIAIKLYNPEKQYKPVLLQAIFRDNFVIIGVPLALRLGGETALSTIVILNVFLIPITNIFSVLSFQLYTPKDKVETWIDTSKKTFINPLMIAIYLGLIAMVFSSGYQSLITELPLIDDVLSMLGATVVPLALIAIGGQFKFKR
jgi:predicted permease